MVSGKPLFSNKEQKYLSNTDFLLTKREIIAKVRHLLEGCSRELKAEFASGTYTIDSIYFSNGYKISRGENYKGLPYLVLDHPGYFVKEEVFSYRVIFWWGHLFSFSLHVAGKHLDDATKQLLKQMNKPFCKNIYICINDSPWQYYFEPDNYQLVSSLSAESIQKIVSDHGFLKIARKSTLEEWPFLTKLTIENLRALSALTGFIEEF